MATVTGLTAARMLEIEAASVVDGEIDEAGHLILKKHDGTEIDAGGAVVSVPEENLVKYDNLTGAYTEATPPSAYPPGMSVLSMDAEETTAQWPTFAGKYGSLMSISYGNWDTTQIWRKLHGGISTVPEMWMRSGNGDSGWSPWRQLTTREYVDGRLQDMTTTEIGPNDPISAYPSGFSIKTMTGATGPVWGSIPTTQFGTIVTFNNGDFRSFQLMQVEDGYLHFRRWRLDQGGWRPWTKVLTEQRLLPADYNHARVMGGYPWGMSYLQLSPSDVSAGGWPFGSKYGLVTTYRYSDDLAIQTWQKHVGGSATGNSDTEMWMRTANSSSGWSRWRLIADELPLYAIQCSSGSVANATLAALSFGASPLSNAGAFVRSTSRITVPYTGTYDISYRYKFNGSVGTGRAFVEFTVATVGQLQFSIPGDTTTFARMPTGAGEDMGSISMTIGLIAGAQVGVNAFQSSGSAKTIDGVFHIRRVS